MADEVNASFCCRGSRPRT